MNYHDAERTNTLRRSGALNVPESAARLKLRARVKIVNNRGVAQYRDVPRLIARTIDALDKARFPLALPGSRDIEAERTQLITQLKNRVLPRMEREATPAVVVLGGSSGAGKSTLFNSLFGEELSAASVLRPTTRTPVIAVHPDDAPLLEGHVLTTLAEVRESAGAIPGLVLVDAPDLDSVDADNRALARTLLNSADLWIFVTTASRYGDATAWSVLTDAHGRGVTTAVVLNRVPASATPTVRADLARRMESSGLGDSPLLIVADNGPTAGLLPPASVAELRQWLESMSETGFGQALITRADAAMFPHMGERLEHIAAAVEMQAEAVEHLRSVVEQSATAPREALRKAALSGRFGAGAPTTAWLSAASSGGPLAGINPAAAPGLGARGRSGARDAAMTTVFEAVRTAADVTLTQQLSEVSEAILTAWAGGVIDTRELAANATAALDLDAIRFRAFSAWMSYLKGAATAAPPNRWFGTAGMAAVLGAAAGGVNGARPLAEGLYRGGAVREAREELARLLDGALTEVTEVFLSQLGDVELGSGRTLRLRAVEFKDRF